MARKAGRPRPGRGGVQQRRAARQQHRRCAGHPGAQEAGTAPPMTVGGGGITTPRRRRGAVRNCREGVRPEGRGRKRAKRLGSARLLIILAASPGADTSGFRNIASPLLELPARRARAQATGQGRNFTGPMHPSHNALPFWRSQCITHTAKGIGLQEQKRSGHAQHFRPSDQRSRILRLHRADDRSGAG